MRTAATLIIAATFAASPAFSQKSEATGKSETSLRRENVTAFASGRENSTGSVKGKTRIKSSKSRTTAVAIGKGNAVANEAGVISSK